MDLVQNKDRDSKVIDLWMQCNTQEKIAEEVNKTSTSPVTQDFVSRLIYGYDKSGKHYPGYVENMENGEIARFHNFTPQLYNIWNFAKNNNETITHSNFTRYKYHI